jgi:hypothetical protein
MLKILNGNALSSIDPSALAIRPLLPLLTQHAINTTHHHQARRSSIEGSKHGRR